MKLFYLREEADNFLDPRSQGIHITLENKRRTDISVSAEPSALLLFTD